MCNGWSGTLEQIVGVKATRHTLERALGLPAS